MGTSIHQITNILLMERNIAEDTAATVLQLTEMDGSILKKYVITGFIMTTEKDCQRVRDSKAVPESLKRRLFYAPIKTEFLSPEDKEQFASVLMSYLK